ncbi:hypothetical protein A2U01_0069909, partial [Trifolium medium]|nr:hypothetical protein [Trifolium medium]
MKGVGGYLWCGGGSVLICKNREEDGGCKHWWGEAHHEAVLCLSGMVVIECDDGGICGGCMVVDGKW